MSKPEFELLFHNVHDHGVEISNRWTREVEKRAGGRVHFTVHTFGGPEVTRRADVVRDVPAEGQKYPLLNLIQIPFIFPSARRGSRVLGQLYAEFPELRAELNDVKLVGLSMGALMALFSSRSWGPLRNMGSLKNARTRSLTPIDKAMAKLGALPLHIDYMQIAPQLQNGQLDATVLGLLPARMFKLADGAAPYCTVVGNTSVTMHPMRTYMKWESWHKLPADIQQIIDSLGPGGPDSWFVQQSGQEADEHVVGALQDFKEKGELIVLPDDEVKRWKALLEPLREESIAEVEARGKPARKFFKRMLELVEKA